MIRLFLGIAAAALGLFAADLSGRWSGTVKMSLDGNEIEMPHELVLEQDGGNVKGTAGPGPEEQWPIRDAAAAGDTLRFTVKAPDGAQLEYRLTLSGGVLSGDYKMILDGRESTAKISVAKK